MGKTLDWRILGAALARGRFASWARSAVTASLAVLLAVQLTELAATIGRPVSPPALATRFGTPPARGSATEPRRDFAQLVEAHLFGEAPEPVEAATPRAAMVAPVLETALDLTLTGVIFVRDGLASRAIIGRAGEQRTYRAGEVIGDGLATLREVRPDGVILERGGRAEMLRLPSFSGSGPTASAANVAWESGATDAVSTALPATLAHSDEAAAQPIRTGLANVLRLAVQRSDDGHVGLRATPGRDHATFKSLGLKSGDVITRVAGRPLDGRRGARALVDELERDGAVALTILRGGVAHAVTIPAGALQDAAQP